MRLRIAAANFAAGAARLSAVCAWALLMFGCSGGDEFKPAPTPRIVGAIGVTATVTVFECPVITSYSMSPCIKAAGIDVALTSTTSASYGARPTYLWSATSGTFVNANSADATYRCGAEVKPRIKLTVSYGSCVDSIEIDELDCS